MVHRTRARIISDALTTLGALVARPDMQTRKVIIIVRRFEKRLKDAMEECT